MPNEREKALDAFQDEVKDLINRHSLENLSDTPDFMLADYLRRCLELHERAVVGRDAWYSPEEGVARHPENDSHHIPERR